MHRITIILSDCNVYSVITDVSDDEIELCIELITERYGNVSYMIEEM